MVDWLCLENACHLKIMEKIPLRVKATKYNVGSTSGEKEKLGGDFIGVLDHLEKRHWETCEEGSDEEKHLPPEHIRQSSDQRG